MIDLNRESSLRDAIELLYFGYRAFTDRPDRILESRGLGRVHHRVLYFVARNPDISIQDLLAILDVTKQALNGPLRQLIEMKLVAMRLGTSDRRVRQLRLTYEGEKLEARLTDTQVQQLGRAFDATGASAEAAWREVMRAIAVRR